MNKKQLKSAWKKLDKCLEAIEHLEEIGIKSDYVDFSAIVNLRDQVEEEISKRTRKERIR